MKTLLISAFASAVLVAGLAYAEKTPESQLLVENSITTTK